MITINLSKDEIYMKKIYFIIALFSFFLVACNANSSKPQINQEENINLTRKHNSSSNIEIPLCEPEGQDINYCSKELRLKIDEEAKKPANFSKNKRILKSKVRMNTDNSNIYEYYFIIIDLDKRTANPLETIILTNYTNRDGIYLSDFKPQVSYSKNSSNICFNGSLIGYKNTYTNVENACFKYNDADEYAFPINTPFKEIEVEKSKKLKSSNNERILVDKNYTLSAFSSSENEINGKSNTIIFSMDDENIFCNLADCIQKTFDKNTYSKLFDVSHVGPIGVTMGTYYNIDNDYGLDIYAAGYTEEGDVNFDYIIVNNGAQTNYIELPINSNYSINSTLEIKGYNTYGKYFKYKISSTGLITEIK